MCSAGSTNCEKEFGKNNIRSNYMAVMKLCLKYRFRTQICLFSILERKKVSEKKTLREHHIIDNS